MKFFLIIFLIVNSMIVNAQGNLEFTNAKFIELTCNSGPPPCTLDSTIIVPANKVWKIESMSLDTDGIIRLNNKIILITNSNEFDSRLPIWLPSGSYTIRIQALNPNNPILYSFISAIEFSIVP